MENNFEKIAVLGKGAFGTAFGRILEDAKYDVHYWDITLNNPLRVVLDGAKYVFVAISAQHCREFLMKNKSVLSELKHVFISLMKGIELNSGLLMSDVIKDVLGNETEVQVVAGPNIAREIIEGDLFGLTVSHEDLKCLLEKNTRAKIEVVNNKEVIQWLSCLKNVYAVYSGYLSGKGVGLSERSKMLTEALWEMRLIIKHVGVLSENCDINQLILSYAGVGDFMVTCFSESSRNFSTGYSIGYAENGGKNVEKCHGVCEGVPTSKIVQKIVADKNIETPILDKVVDLVSQK